MELFITKNALLLLECSPSEGPRSGHRPVPIRESPQKVPIFANPMECFRRGSFQKKGMEIQTWKVARGSYVGTVLGEGDNCMITGWEARGVTYKASYWLQPKTVINNFTNSAHETITRHHFSFVLIWSINMLRNNKNQTIVWTIFLSVFCKKCHIY